MTLAKTLFTLFTLTMVSLAIIGGIVNYSPIPFWDMWVSVVSFMMRVHDGDYRVWWELSNEHRIILSRVLFWIDYQFFHGISVFLIIMNYVIVAVACWVFWTILSAFKSDQHSTAPIYLIWLFICAWLFLWVQSGNFTWAFQSQFFLAQLLPLCAFFYYGQSLQTHSKCLFAVACFSGVVSIGTMANGVLALPLMFVYSLLIRETAMRRICLLLLAIMVNVTYFYHYQAPGNHGQLSEILKIQPLDLIRYSLRYLGSPFYYLSGYQSRLAELAGGVFALSSLWFFIKQLVTKEKSPLILALLFFIIYIAGTAFGTGSGRLVFGLNQALESRYTTPAIMAWAAWGIILWQSYRFNFRYTKQSILLITVIFTVLMLRYQLKALKPQTEQLVNAQIAGLALSLAIYDDRYLRQVSASSEYALYQSWLAKRYRYGFFTQYPYTNLEQEIGQPYLATAAPLQNLCLGEIQSAVHFREGVNYVRITGWLHDKQTGKAPKLIRFVDAKGINTGFALTGFPSPKTLFHQHTHDEDNSGFVGYLQSTAVNTTLSVIGDSPRCSLTLSVPSLVAPPTEKHLKK